jgi:hypothetical protein
MKCGYELVYGKQFGKSEKQVTLEYLLSPNHLPLALALLLLDSKVFCDVLVLVF